MSPQPRIIINDNNGKKCHEAKRDKKHHKDKKHTAVKTHYKYLVKKGDNKDIKHPKDNTHKKDNHHKDGVKKNKKNK